VRDVGVTATVFSEIQILLSIKLDTYIKYLHINFKKNPLKNNINRNGCISQEW